jgi:3-carboxy-cis,cis-muconate cycloisomerase
LPSSGLFTPIFVPEAVQEAVSDEAWLQAMLDVEAALARAQAGAGVIPRDAALAITAACRAERFDVGELGRAARGPGNPVPPLVRALDEAVGRDAARFVHWGATSQDMTDTAAMLVARRALDLVIAELDAVAGACAALAEEHRTTLMAGRTMMQQALPVTFGLKAAGWLAQMLDARDALIALRRSGLAVQLGGAAGTLASLGDAGPAVIEALAQELDLEAPELPWQSARMRVAAIGASLALAAGALSKVALDVVLLAQTEVGEVSEPPGGGRGGSSAMPHKRNPIEAVITRACARRVRAAATVLLEAMEQEHERAAGAWHSEWEPLREALALTGGAAASLRDGLAALEVQPGRMRENLDRTGGVVLAEHAVLLLARRVGRPEARRVVDAAIERGGSLREELAGDLSPDELDEAFDPARYLGSADTFIDRALARHRA